MKIVSFFKVTELPAEPKPNALYFVKSPAGVTLYVTSSTGIPEPVGGEGSGDVNYVHPQIIASNEWVINHGLGKKPAVTIVDSGDNVVIGDVQYVSDNILVVRFSAPFGGSAYLN